MAVEAAGGLKPFQTIMYTTKDGEHCTATKKDGIVTVVGDKNGTRQLELETFMKNELINNVQNINLENSPEKDSVSFKGYHDIDKGDYIERHIETEASIAKKLGVGLASYVLPGLGQFINGDNTKGLACLGLSVATMLASSLAACKGKIGIALATAVPLLGTQIYSIVNAFKNAKSEVVQIVNK